MARLFFSLWSVTSGGACVCSPVLELLLRGWCNGFVKESFEHQVLYTGGDRGRCSARQSILCVVTLSGALALRYTILLNIVVPRCLLNVGDTLLVPTLISLVPKGGAKRLESTPSCLITTSTTFKSPTFSIVPAPTSYGAMLSIMTCQGVHYTPNT
jgi:hypothetical protein